jgi:hypothetical protein
MKEEYKHRRAAKHAAEKAANSKTERTITLGDVPAFYKKIKSQKTEFGTELKSQASEMLTSGWDGVGYLMIATTPELITDKTGIGRKRFVLASHGEAAMLEFQGWFRERITEGYVAGWRFYLSRKDVGHMQDAEFKGTVVYRKCSSRGSVIAELISLVFDERLTPGDFEWFARKLSKYMDVESIADMFLTMFEMDALGATITWTVGE